MRLEQLTAGHAAALLRFETENRDYFARSVSDRGDAYFADFAARHAALLAEQSAGRSRFHVLVDDGGAVLGRFNLFDLENGGADLGYRVAQRATGRGVAKYGVREVGALARRVYHLERLMASAAVDNAASLAVLRATGFVAIGEVDLFGRRGVRHVLDLTTAPSTPE
jgi:ribosomal-protein-alanine N-acetyltransferase